MNSSEAFSSLLPALAEVLDTSQRQDEPVSKQALLNTTNEFKDTLARARHVATTLPGGDMSLADQDEIIQMLEKLREYKKAQLQYFAQMASTNSKPSEVGS